MGEFERMLERIIAVVAGLVVLYAFLATVTRVDKYTYMDIVKSVLIACATSSALSTVG